MSTTYIDAALQAVSLYYVVEVLEKSSRGFREAFEPAFAMLIATRLKWASGLKVVQVSRACLRCGSFPELVRSSGGIAHPSSFSFKRTIPRPGERFSGVISS